MKLFESGVAVKPGQRSRVSTSRLLCLCCLGVAALAFGQATIPKNNHYEVVSIRPGIKGQPAGFHPSPLEFRIENWSLQALIANLYGVPQDRIIGLPAWTSSETFSFRAKSVVPASNYGESWGMLIPVLEDRFKLKYHREKRQMRVHELSVEATRIKFPVTDPGSCEPSKPDNFEPDADSGGSKAAAKPVPRSCGRLLIQPLREGGFNLSGKAIGMAQLGHALERFVGGPVVDRTDLTMLFDIESLNFSITGTGVSSPLAAGSKGWQEGAANPGEPNAPSGLPSISAALKKVGLRLTRGEGPVEVLMIDKLERPSEN